MKLIKLFLFLSVYLLAHTSESQNLPRRLPFVSYTEVGGLFGRVIAGTQVNEVVANKTNLTLQTLNGVQVSNRVVIGALVGIDWYNAALMMPVGAGLRWQIAQATDRNISFFASTDAGYAFTWLHKSSTGYSLKGGLMLNPGIGIRLGKAAKGGLVLSLGYKRQAAQVDKPLRWGEISRTENRIYNRLAIRMGISF